MVRRRKCIDNVKGAELRRLADAFDNMNDVFALPFKYPCWAAIHNVCPHASALFLPWHRAYLFAFEEALRRIGGDVTLPYWDWTTKPTLPEAVLDKCSALYHDRFDPGYDPRRDPDVHLPTAAEVRDVSAIRDFDRFGGVGCSGPGQYGGELEKIHNAVHRWVGGDMFLPGTASRDPLFWFHHANVDRLWAEWQVDHSGGPGCCDMALPGIVDGWRLRDVETIRSCRLGYEYVDDTIVVASDVELSTTRQVDLNMPVSRADRSLYLLIEDVTTEAAASSPSAINMFAFGLDQPVAQVPLFGFMDHRMTRLTADREHHGTGHNHAMTLRVDLDQLRVSAVESGKLVLQIRVARSSARDVSGLSIRQITLITV